MVWVTSILFPVASVTLYVLVITFPAVTSPSKATTGTLQLSKASVTTLMSAAGTSAAHCTLTATGLLAVGSVVSFITTA